MLKQKSNRYETGHHGDPVTHLVLLTNKTNQRPSVREPYKSLMPSLVMSPRARLSFSVSCSKKKPTKSTRLFSKKCAAYLAAPHA